jgi:hypothetical protein
LKNNSSSSEDQSKEKKMNKNNSIYIQYPHTEPEKFSIDTTRPENFNPPQFIGKYLKKNDPLINECIDAESLIGQYSSIGRAASPIRIDQQKTWPEIVKMWGIDPDWDKDSDDEFEPTIVTEKVENKTSNDRQAKKEAKMAAIKAAREKARAEKEKKRLEKVSHTHPRKGCLHKKELALQD